MVMWVRGCVWLMLCCLCAPAMAANVELRVSGHKLQVGQVAELRVVVTEQRPNSVPQVLVPQSGLNLQYVGQGSQVNTYNGRTTRIYTFNYRIEALAEGTFQIGPAQVRLGNDTLKTRTVNLKVNPRVQMSGDMLEAFAHWDVEEAWVGQVILYQRGLRSRKKLRGDRWSDLPKEGVGFLNDGKPKYSEFMIADPEGDIYNKQETFPWIALVPGTYKAPPGILRVDVVVGREGRGFFVRHKTRKEVLSVEHKPLVIKELPPAPPGFSGLVGDFKVRSEISTSEATVGASIPWVLEVEGKGSLENFDWSIEKDQKGARVYDGTPSVSGAVIDGSYFALARFEQVIVPTQPGTLALPSQKIITFSPTKGEYVTHDISIPSMKIEKGVAQDGTFTSFVDHLTRPEEFQQTPSYEGVRPPYATGATYAKVWGHWMPWLAFLTGMPMLFWLLLSGWNVLSEWNRKRLAARVPKEPDILTQLNRLPEQGDARLAALESLLMRAHRQAGLAVDEEIQKEQSELMALIHSVRFGGKRATDDLDARTVDLIRRMTSLRKEAS